MTLEPLVIEHGFAWVIKKDDTGESILGNDFDDDRLREIGPNGETYTKEGWCWIWCDVENDTPFNGNFATRQEAFDSAFDTLFAKCEDKSIRKGRTQDWLDLAKTESVCDKRVRQQAGIKTN